MILSKINSMKTVLFFDPNLRELVNNFDPQKYFIILNELFNYTKENLTTKNIANYILSKI